MRRWLIERLGGFWDKQSYLNSLSEDDRHEVLSRAVAKLFNTVREDDIFRRDEDGQVTFEGKPLLEEQVKALRSEAQHILDSHTFKVIDKEVQYQINRRMYYHSQSADDLIACKSALWIWDVIKSTLRRL